MNIDFEKMREELRETYANYPTNGDWTLEFEARNAGLMADMIVLIAKEESRNSAPADVVCGIAAIASAALEVLCQRINGADREKVCEAFAEIVTGYVAKGKEGSYTSHETPLKAN